MVREQNPPLIAMLSLLVSLLILVNTLDSTYRAVGIIALVIYATYYLYKLIWFIKNRNLDKVMELLEDSIKIADKIYPFKDIKKINIIDTILDIRKHNPLSHYIYYIKKEEKEALISSIREMTKDHDIQTRLE